MAAEFVQLLWFGRFEDADSSDTEPFCESLREFFDAQRSSKGRKTLREALVQNGLEIQNEEEPASVILFFIFHHFGFLDAWENQLPVEQRSRSEGVIAFAVVIDVTNL